MSGKYLSWILRHRPDALGLTLQPGGWVDVEALLKGLEATEHAMSFGVLRATVAADSKGRFSFDADETRIRANQGHSATVELQLLAEDPPSVLFHGTVARFLDSIRAVGLLRGERHHVHLASNEASAIEVGSRRGRPILLRIDSAQMKADGYVFYCSTNGVWLTESVPPGYLTELAANS